MPELEHRRLRAPQADGAALIEPPLQSAARIARANQAALQEFEQRGGFPPGFRSVARAQLMALLGIGHTLPAGPLIFSGHQPELFHPGVWFKNFLLSAIARSCGGVAVNLVIDNDTVRAAGIRVPAGSPQSPEIAFVPFDAAGEAIPWEERGILDRDLFAGFQDAVRRTFVPPRLSSGTSRELILDRLWPHALALSQWTSHPPETSPWGGEDALQSPSVVPSLSHCLTHARHRLERELGLATTETTLSSVASSPSFLTFAAAIFGRHREFHAIHNAALAEFRHVNRVRSRTHPVPDLAHEDDWCEVPFWLWTAADPRRRRVFVRQAGNSWELTDRSGIVIRARASEWPEMRHFSAQLARQRVRLRPRALITTMYARLVLSDLFIHGIGGAKYDELTDLIMRRFYRVEPPVYVTATATCRLPIERPAVSPSRVRDSARRIRDLRYRPEAFVSDPLIASDRHVAEQLVSLAAEKHAYLAQHDLRRCSSDVFVRLDQLNRTMHDLLQPVEHELRARHSRLLAQLKQARLLGSREFSFVLFPSEILPARLLDLCKLSP